MALTGNETLEVLGQSTNGQPASQTETTTTGAIAALAAAGSTSLIFTALNTVGAGTITAAGIVGKATNRGGTQTAVFTDTTATAVAIIAALPAGSQVVGDAFQYTYVNNTVFPATITGGTGVTVSGITVVPANSWARFIVTYSAASTVTVVGIEQGYFPSSGTYINNGASAVTVANTAVTANSNILFTLKSVGGTVSASAPNIKTITPGTGFTVAGLASDTSTYNYEIRG